MQVTTEKYSSKSDLSIDQCIRDCLVSFQACSGCLPHCLDMGGKHADKGHIGLLIECAEMCRMSASLMLAKSQFSHEHCQLCARVCDLCAASCESVDADDEMMAQCAETCRRSADSCRSMSH